jgi:hypothetical protein
MTSRERILALSPKELNAEVAEHIFDRKRYVYGHGTRYHLLLPKDATGPLYEPAPPGMKLADTQQVSIPNYSSDYNAVRAMEDEIERRGLIDEYLQCLASIVQTEHLSVLRQVFRKLLRASCVQRCQAALLCIERDENG